MLGGAQHSVWSTKDYVCYSLLLIYCFTTFYLYIQTNSTQVDVSVFELLIISDPGV